MMVAYSGILVYRNGSGQMRVTFYAPSQRALFSNLKSHWGDSVISNVWSGVPLSESQLIKKAVDSE